MRDALPHASYLGFTGTPLELEDKNTRAVFGDYISIYDIERAVEDGATVPIYYESRLAKLALDEEQLPRLDSEFEEATEGEELEQREKLKTKWAQLEAIVGTDDRVHLVARDLVEHFEQRQEAMLGKAMVVAMSRRIAMDLYDAIVELRPDWHHDDDEHGAIKVVMTGNAAEGPRVAMHARNKPRHDALATRFRDPDDPLKIVIVRDMWLTGFDAPVLHTMYIDKPMQGHGLMQAIARVNRKFRDKPGGLIEELIDLAKNMNEAARRGEDLGLNDDERAFYDALETNDSAVAVLGDDTLREIARELVEKVKANTTIDWTEREHVRAQLRVIVRRTLRRHGYPPDKREQATETVLEQAALLSAEWAA